MTTQEHLNKIKDAVIKAMQQRLVDEDINACGDLTRSFEGKITPHAIEISFYEYGAFVDTGTKPRTSKGGDGFYNEILEWTKCKGLTPTNGTREQMAWAIYKNIWNEGTQPHKWIDTFPKTVLKFQDEILKLTHTYLTETNTFERISRMFSSDPLPEFKKIKL